MASKTGAERGSAVQRRGPTILDELIRWALSAQPTGRARSRHHAQARAAQKERALLAWSYSIPDHDDLVTSKALNRNTSSPALGLTSHRNRMHRRPARPPQLRARLASQIASKLN